MLKHNFVLAAILLFAYQIAAETNSAFNLGDTFPNFEAETTIGDINFYKWMKESWAIIFTHPADFAPVCTTELARLEQLLPEFEKRNVKPIALVIDKVENHREWIEDIKAYANLTTFDYPLIGDEHRHLAVLLTMLDKDTVDKEGLPLKCRGVFLIDDKKKLRLSLMYPATVGRNFDEILRIIDSIQQTESKHVATPVDWKPGQMTIVMPTVPNDQLSTLFPAGVQQIPLPSGKSYMRVTPKRTTVGAADAAAAGAAPGAPAARMSPIGEFKKKTD